MKKRYLYMIIILLILSLNTVNVSASDFNLINLGVNCNGLFTAEGVQIIRKYLNYFRIVGPIVLIVMISFDLFKAVLSGDDQNVKKAQKSILGRVIACILLFLVPSLVRFLLGMPAIQEAIQIPDDPICNALKTNNINIKEII